MPACDVSAMPAATSASAVNADTNLPAPVPQRAKGSAALHIAQSDDASKVARLYQSGCAKIRLPRRNCPHLEAVVINTSGGMTGGDELDYQFTAHQGASAQITTQACERVYKSTGGSARLDIKLDVHADAKLAWLPQETILFDQGQLSRKLDVTLHGNAQILIVEPAILGRGAMGETVDTGLLSDRWRIWQDRQLLHAEQLRLDGRIHANAGRPFALNGNMAMATVFAVSTAAEGAVDEIRDIIGENGSASFWNGKLLARIVAKDGYLLRKRLLPIIGLLNFEAQVPKVWAL